MGLNDYIKIGERSKDLRKRKDIKQNEMALKLGIPISTYSNYENDNREPSSETLENISKILNMTVEELIGLDLEINLSEISIDELLSEIKRRCS